MTMATEARVGGERRTGTRDMLDKLLSERKDMLALYWQVAGLEPATANDHAT